MKNKITDRSHTRFQISNLSLLAMVSSGLLFIPHLYNLVPMIIAISGVKIYDLWQNYENPTKQSIYNCLSLMCIWILGSSLRAW